MIGTFTKTGDTPAWAMEGFGAYAAADASPRYGPGEDYNDFGGEVLPTGSEVRVFFEENGWVFMEFMSSQGLDRGWVPAGYVVPANQYDGSRVTNITLPPAATATPRPAATRSPAAERFEPVTPSPITPEPVAPEADEPEAAASEFDWVPPVGWTSITEAPFVPPVAEIQLPLKVEAEISNVEIGGSEGVYVRAQASGGTGNYSYSITLYRDNHSVESRWLSTDYGYIFKAQPGYTYKASVEVFDGLTRQLVFTQSIRVD